LHEGGVPLPLTPELRAPHPLCYVSFFLCACLLFIIFSLVGVSVSMGLC
jgi:hypothetical protein